MLILATFIYCFLIRCTMHKILAIVLLLLGALLIYSPHVWHSGPYMNPERAELSTEPLGNYPYPLHADGWNHLAQARFLIEHHKLRNIDSQRSFNLYSATYNKSVTVEYAFFSPQKGFHIFLASMSYITNIPLTDLAPFFPAILFFLIGLFVFLFFDSVLKSPLAGLFAIALLAFLPSNSYLLGLWFIVPVNMVLFFLCFGFLQEFSFTWNSLISTFLLLIVSWFVYPLATLLLLPYFAFTIGFKYKKAVRQWWSKPVSRWHVFGVVLFVVFIFLLFMKKFIFTMGWMGTKQVLTIFHVLPWPFVLLGFSGIVFLYFSNKSLAFFFSLVLLFFAALYFLYPLVGFTVFFPYARLLLLSGFFLASLASFALARIIYYFIIWLSKKIDLSTKAKKYIQLLVTTIILIIFVLIFLPNYYVADPIGDSVQVIVHPNQLSLLESVGKADGPIIADRFFSQAIYPLSGNKIVAAQKANIGGESSFTYKEFIQANCSSKFELAWNSWTEFVITDYYFSCPYFEDVGRKGKYFLYKFSMFKLFVRV